MTRRLPVCVILLVWSAAGGCSGREETSVRETPTLDVTSWTDKTELFMEYPPLVAGQTARFAVHLTRLADFKALTVGRPRLEFVPERGGPASTVPGNEPSRPGVFRAEGTVPAAGRYRWALLYDGPGLSDRHDLGVATVFADGAAANADVEQRPPEESAAFSYLKEQQWANTFAAEPVRERQLRASVRVPATIEPVTGGEAIVSAPAAGRFAADALVPVGSVVTAGQILGRLEPRQTDATARPSPPTRRKPGLGWTPPGQTWRVPNICLLNAPCRPAASKRLDVRPVSLRPDGNRPRPGLRSAIRCSVREVVGRPAMPFYCARQSRDALSV